MLRMISKSIFLLLSSVVICCILYPLTLWVIGQIVFSFQANGSLLKDPKGQIIGSKLIAQPFTDPGYFYPRPSAASYDASASSSSSLAASNYLLRNRVAKALGPLVTYRDAKKGAKFVAPDIDQWFQNTPNVLSTWATNHPSLAIEWATQDTTLSEYINAWAKLHPALVKEFAQINFEINPQIDTLAPLFFKLYPEENPGAYPAKNRSDIASLFFDQWLQVHPHVDLNTVPADMVTTSASGLDPHITVKNASFQLDRVAKTWAKRLNRNEPEILFEIEDLIHQHHLAPWYGLAGVKIVNVLELNLELYKKYGILEKNARS